MPCLAAAPRRAAPSSRARLALHAALCLALAPGCQTPDRSSPVVGSTAAPGFEACRQPGAGAPARCGTVDVALDPRDPGRGTIALRVVILPATDQVERPPLYALAGGPGQAATEAFSALLPALAPVRERREIVLVDMRGTGGSMAMACPAPTDPQALLRATPDLARLRACLDTLPLAPRDVTTARLVDDLEAVRAALGHDRIALMGASYGTRLALAYMAAHDQRVDAAILDGVAPPQMVLFQDFAADAQAAWDAHARACAQRPACAAAFPDVRGDLDRALARLDRGPVDVTLTHPRTGQSHDLTLGRAMVATAVRGLLYATDLAPLLPYTVHQAAEGRWQPLVGQALVLAEGAAGSLSEGMMLSIVCAEDVPRLDLARARDDARDTFLGATVIDMMAPLCAHWPAAPLPPGAGEPVTSAVPTLLLSGARDPVTPPRWAELAARTLPRGRALVAPGQAHGTLTAGCVPDLLARFLDAPAQIHDLDAGCLQDLDAPPAFTGFWGPPP